MSFFNFLLRYFRIDLHLLPMPSLHSSMGSSTLHTPDFLMPTLSVFSDVLFNQTLSLVYLFNLPHPLISAIYQIHTDFFSCHYTLHLLPDHSLDSKCPITFYSQNSQYLFATCLCQLLSHLSGVLFMVFIFLPGQLSSDALPLKTQKSVHSSIVPLFLS